MPRDHNHQWTYPHLRLLTMALPGDGHYRVYTDRRCRHCGRYEASTGSATKHTGGAPLPWMGTFWENAHALCTDLSRAG